jgi:hypothetical protein
MLRNCCAHDGMEVYLKLANLVYGVTVGTAGPCACAVYLALVVTYCTGGDSMRTRAQNRAERPESTQQS